MNLTKGLYELIEKECEKFVEETFHTYDINIGDVLFSYFHSTEDDFYIWNDWDEGESSDPFWDKELAEHSCIVFLKQICKKIKEYELADTDIVP